MRPDPRLALVGLLGLVAGVLAVVQYRWQPALPDSLHAPVAGQVIAGDCPVAGVRVRFRGTAPFALTDRNGRFTLPGSPGPVRRVTAAREGYFIAGAPADSRSMTLRLEPVPATDHEAYTWVDPAPDAADAHRCGRCHPAIYQEWSASGHARSATNRRFLNLYDGSDWHGRPHIGWDLLADHPAGAGVCNACHAPTAGFDDDLRRLTGVAGRGVHCDYCHKIADASTDHLGLTHGRFGLTLRRPAHGQLFFGPLDDVDRGDDSYAPLYRESRYCASCHEGVVFGVPVYTTYSEWLASPARREGKQCQTCHMPPSGDLTNLAPGHGGIPRDPQTLASHHLPGGRPDMLGRCLTVSVQLERTDRIVHVGVEVLAHGVGHRVPTGFVDRNLLLVLEATDEQGRPVPLQSGPTLPRAAGRVAGLPGQLYAKQLAGFDGASPAPFWRADPELTDTRLLPDQASWAKYTFPAEVTRLRLRLLYRRFWEEVAQVKGWPDNEVTLVDEPLNVPGEQSPTRRRRTFP